MFTRKTKVPGYRLCNTRFGEKGNVLHTRTVTAPLIIESKATTPSIIGGVYCSVDVAVTCRLCKLQSESSVSVKQPTLV